MTCGMSRAELLDARLFAVPCLHGQQSRGTLNPLMLMHYATRTVFHPFIAFFSAQTPSSTVSIRLFEGYSVPNASRSDNACVDALKEVLPGWLFISFARLIRKGTALHVRVRLMSTLLPAARCGLQMGFAVAPLFPTVAE